MAQFEPVSHHQVREAIPSKIHRPAIWIAAAGVILLAVALLAMVAILETPTPKPGCGLKCPAVPPPSVGQVKPRSIPFKATSASIVRFPVQFNKSYDSTRYGYRVYWDAHDLPFAPYQESADAVAWNLADRNDNPFVVELKGIPAHGRSAAQMISDIAKATVPDFRHVYDIPGAEVGYVSGAGAVYDGTIIPADGSALHGRVSFEIAIKRGLAVAVEQEGHIVLDNGSFANPAELPDDSLSDTLANTVTWKGDPHQ